MAYQKKKKSRRTSSKFVKAIQTLKRMRPKQRYIAIRHSNDKFIRDVVSHVRKLRNRKLSPKMKGIVKKHTKSLRLLANGKVSLKRKRNRLSQKGGGILGVLLPLLSAVAGPIIQRALS